MSSSDYEPLHLDWPGLANARDLGGLPVEGGAIREGALIRTESLTRLTEPDLLRDAGVSLIVDLRRPNESPEPHPFADDDIYVNLPVEDPADQKNIDSTMGALYLEMLDARPDLFAAALGSMAEAEPGAVLVHCAAGKDRTGLVVALALSVAGAEPEVVAADYAHDGGAAGTVRRGVPRHDRGRAAARVLAGPPGHAGGVHARRARPPRGRARRRRGLPAVRRDDRRAAQCAAGAAGRLSWSSIAAGLATYAASANSGSTSRVSTTSGQVQPPVASCSAPNENGPAAAMR